MMAPRKPEPGRALADLQRAIAGAVMQPLARGERISAASAEVAGRLIKPNDRLTSRERLQIYNQQYWWRLLGSMREDFGGLLAVLGERKFEKLVVAYLHECGSQSWSLRNLGQQLEAFVRAHPALTAPREALALDMVRVEWARVVAFDGPEEQPLDPARLGRDPARLRLGLQPHLTLLDLGFPIDHLLARLKQKEAGVASNAVTSSAPRVAKPALGRVKPERVFLSVYRNDLSVYYKRLAPEAFKLLCDLRDGQSLEHACDAAFSNSGMKAEAAAEAVQGWFAQWTFLGWLVAKSRRVRAPQAARVG